MSIAFNEEQFFNFFDEKRTYSQEAEIMSYFKKYEGGYLFDVYLSIYEGTAIISLYKKNNDRTIFSSKFEYIVENITCEDGSIKLYTHDNALLTELLLKPMVSLKLSV